MSDWTVRRAEPGDAAAIVPLYEWLFAPPGSRPSGWDPELALERLGGAIASDRSAVFVAASRDGDLLGLCTAYLDLLSVRYGSRCWVEDLVVDPERRSGGVGAALLAAAREWAAARGASHLELDSGEARTDAHRFYDREGAANRSFCFGWWLEDDRGY